mmetsp:Transcript_32134/g.92243  ORF Transcript_32134/g.92243 Transcript_32134/m.92243 type:complete len:149 (+) Transcript_32134:116-562(+)
MPVIEEPALLPLGLNSDDVVMECAPPLLHEGCPEVEAGPPLATAPAAPGEGIEGLRCKALATMEAALGSGHLDRAIVHVLMKPSEEPMAPPKADASSATLRLEAEVAKLTAELEAARRECEALRQENSLLRESTAGGSALYAIRAAKA